MTLTPVSSLESARGRNDSNTAQFARRKKFLMNSTYIMSRKWEKNKTFFAQEAEMTLTPLSSLESARKKFLMNSTYIMSRKWESNVFELRLESAKKKFSMNSMYIMSRKW